MKKQLGVFVVFFALGVVIAVIIRAATYHPSSQTPVMPSMSPAEHVAHTLAAPVAATQASVNSTCPICGMPVNPAIPFVDYKGVKVGFGCTACPPKFAGNPAKYGEAALKNQVVE
jgi:YHS domain-containing protein